MAHYYLSNAGQTAGPFPLSELPQHGLLNSSLVWADGMATWQPATDVPEVAVLLRPAAPPTPPPLPAYTPSPPPAPEATYTYAPSPTSKSSSSGLGSLFAKNPAAWITGGIAAAGLLVVGMARMSNADASAYSPSADTEVVSAESIAAQQQAAAEELRKEKQRLWNREHFMEYVQADVLPGYRVVGFGGISDGHVQFTNNSGYRVRDVVMAVAYIKSDGGVHKVEYATIDEVPAHEARVIAVPNSERGTSLRCFVQRLRAPGLEFQYQR